MQGFIIFDTFGAKEHEVFVKDMTGWLEDGKVQYREQVVEGLEAAPEAFLDLLEGRNFGKMVVRVG
ncbi:hypothetical protein [Jannaschia donghaensis]|uniref:NADPH-dependent curcumin reductase n=1 Tax=Jannaschia donghaensis TaxID=420998 RepID=A0A0M6YL26_9RHOB|nr:hypothetical protein [Jannaschia donghaensis]CTQ50529.1 NADPH-dependent curcumin reductase [Jannaschia donghaensis]